MSASRTVPFSAIAGEWAAVRDETMERVSAVFEHGRFVEGPEIEELETRLSSDLDGSRVLACGSGTTALLMAMLALGIGQGDEVIVPAFTFPAPVECALLLGATPVLVDVDYPSGLICPASVRASITPRTRAIVAVSLFGLVPDFNVLEEIARDHGVPLLEDAAQSYGARRDGRASGTFGRINALSFFPTKAFGGAGDGGAVATGDPELADRLRMIRDHGQDTRNNHVCLGLNGRMSSIAAAALLVRHDRLQAALESRRRLARLYDDHFREEAFAGRIRFHAPEGEILPARAQYTVAIQDQDRDRVRRDLLAGGVETSVYYPRPLHDQPAFRQMPRASSLKNAEALARDIIALPLHPSLEEADIAHVASVLRTCL